MDSAQLFLTFLHRFRHVLPVASGEHGPATHPKPPSAPVLWQLPVGQTPHERPPQPSSNSPHVAPSDAQVASFVQRQLPSAHSRGGGQSPHAYTTPQAST